MRETRDILALHDTLGDTPAVLATVVDVIGSAYRRPGARMLLARDGRRAGSISGGCLEHDLARRAFALTRSGPRLIAYDTRGDTVRPAGAFNTGCDGVIRVFIEDGTDVALGPLRRAMNAADATPIATVYAVHGDVDIAVGTRFTQTEETPGRNSIAACVHEDLRVISVSDAPISKRYEFDDGVVDMLLEPMHPPRPLVIFGDGDDVRPMVEMAHVLGWRCTVCGKRPTLARRERFPLADHVLCGSPRDALAAVRLTRRSAVALLTHDYGDDLELLPALLDSPAFHVALLGPKRRTGRLLSELHDRGLLPGGDGLEKLRTPAGLDLGGDAPAAVALSVLAEIEARANARTGGPLQQRVGPIHDPHERTQTTAQRVLA